ncbi:MAG: DUF4954 family protein [Fibrobacterota bacterium]
MARKLTKDETDRLKANGCTAESWDTVQVHDGFLTDRVRNSHFAGKVLLGKNSGTLFAAGVNYPCGVYGATLVNSEVRDNALVRNVGAHVSNYVIEEGAVVLNVAELSATPNATFGQGTPIEALNEAGGRELPLSVALTSQIAYLLSVYRYRPALVSALETLLKKETERFKGQPGRVRRDARVINCGAIRDVMIGANAQVTGVAGLTSGIIDSNDLDPVIVGEGVSADSFVILSGAHVTTHAILNRVFVGQGARIGKQFSAENSVFFANCEGFHGEACAIFAGPYTVTHHKSSLLIAAMYSFYNAGSGTNHSNHMYKLGPVHQGVLERGCKTGSFSYLLLEAHLAPFCIVLGKHMANINIPDFPFSYISESGGKTYLTPAMNLITIGTVRDQEKWAQRDRRKDSDKKDILNPSVYSPFTVERMLRGRDALMKIHTETPKDVESVNVGNTLLSRLLCKNSAKYYTMTLERYLCQKTFVKIEDRLKTGASWADALASLAPAHEPDMEWVDVCGLLAPKKALDTVLKKLETGGFESTEDFTDALASLHAAYADHEWAYAYARFSSVFAVSPDRLTKEKAVELLESWKTTSKKIFNMIQADAEKEYEDFAKISYGQDGGEADAAADFKAVRGDKLTNKVLVKMREGNEKFLAGVDALVALVKEAK